MKPGVKLVIRMVFILGPVARSAQNHVLSKNSLIEIFRNILTDQCEKIEGFKKLHEMCDQRYLPEYPIGNGFGA